MSGPRYPVTSRSGDEEFREIINRRTLLRCYARDNTPSILAPILDSLAAHSIPLSWPVSRPFPHSHGNPLAIAYAVP